MLGQRQPHLARGIIKPQESGRGKKKKSYGRSIGSGGEKVMAQCVPSSWPVMIFTIRGQKMYQDTPLDQLIHQPGGNHDFLTCPVHPISVRVVLFCVAIQSSRSW